MPTTKLVDPCRDRELLSTIGDARTIGIDTEFMRERTYFAQLCLVQIATPDVIYCADPLGDGDLGEFWEALMRCGWVLHSGRQDIEVIYQATERMPAALLDTQVAAALSGYAPQIGYAPLVKELFGKDLPKGHTRADWSRRPLTDAMLSYASEDVEYLLPACELLSERLDRLGRLGWAEEDSAALLDRSLYDIDPERAVDRLKGARNLRGRARRAAVALARWRERRALKSDRPRRWILKDAVLIDIAQSNPADERELAAIDGMPPATAKRASTELLRILETAANSSDDYVPPERPDQRQKAILKRLQKEVGDCAEALGVSAEIVAPRKELSGAILGERESRVFSGWRRAVIGERLVELLD